MRAVTYRGPSNLVVEDHRTKPLQSGEVRASVEGAGVCGTDVRIYKGEPSAYAQAEGRVPGHEMVGRLEESAAADLGPGLAVGSLVFVAPNVGAELRPVWHWQREPLTRHRRHRQHP